LFEDIPRMNKLVCDNCGRALDVDDLTCPNCDVDEIEARNEEGDD